MKTITEVLPILREQVTQGIYADEAEAIAEFELIQERRMRRIAKSM